MATAAQIEANQRNAKRSTGPRTDRGKSRARLNSFKHGMAARTIMPVLPQEDPKQLEERIQEWISDVQPRNAIECELVYQAARLSLAIDRGERIETAHLTRRVRKAEQVRAQRPGAAAQAGSRARPQAAVHRRARRGQGVPDVTLGRRPGTAG